MEKAYKFRMYPNKKQEEIINKTFGCCRFVYNKFLAKRIEIYENSKETYSYKQCSSDLTILKKELLWLKEPDKFSLQNSLKDLEVAYKNFFRSKDVGFPKFKSKKTNRFSYRTNFTNNNIEYCGKYIKLPKLGTVKIRDKHIPQGRILNATVSKEPSGKYYISLCCTDIEVELFEKTNKSIGLDLGIKDFLNKLSTKLIKENDVICIEDLQVKEMIKSSKSNHRRSIANVSWYEFTRQLEYKANWYGKEIIKVDKYFASSQLCNICNFKNKNIKDLNIREWECPQCGAIHQRDINAAINIFNEGIKLKSLL